MATMYVHRYVDLIENFFDPQCICVFHEQHRGRERMKNFST